MEGNLRFKIDWPYSWKEIYHFCIVLPLYLREISKYKPPGGLYLEGRFNGRFFALRVWGAYIWRGQEPIKFYGLLEGLIFGILR